MILKLGQNVSIYQPVRSLKCILDFNFKSKYLFVLGISMHGLSLTEKQQQIRKNLRFKESDVKLVLMSLIPTYLLEAWKRVKQQSCHGQAPNLDDK